MCQVLFGAGSHARVPGQAKASLTTAASRGSAAAGGLAHVWA